jgi:hypothetical protein
MRDGDCWKLGCDLSVHPVARLLQRRFGQAASAARFGVLIASPLSFLDRTSVVDCIEPHDDHQVNQIIFSSPPTLHHRIGFGIIFDSGSQTWAGQRSLLMRITSSRFEKRQPGSALQ